MGSPRCPEIWAVRSSELVLGGVERAGHQLLAWYAGGLRQALRLRSRWREARVARGKSGRPCYNRTRKREGRKISPAVSGTLRIGKERRDRENRSAPRLYYVSRQRQTDSRRRSRANGNFKECPR